MRTNQLGQLPIKLAPKKSIEEVVALVRKIEKCVNRGHSSSQLENAINEKIYEIYGLNSKEIDAMHQELYDAKPRNEKKAA